MPRDIAPPPRIPSWASLGLSGRPKPTAQEMMDSIALATTPIPVVGDIAGVA